MCFNKPQMRQRSLCLQYTQVSTGAPTVTHLWEFSPSSILRLKQLFSCVGLILFAAFCTISASIHDRNIFICFLVFSQSVTRSIPIPGPLFVSAVTFWGKKMCICLFNFQIFGCLYLRCVAVRDKINTAVFDIYIYIYFTVSIFTWAQLKCSLRKKERKKANFDPVNETISSS